MLAAAAVIRPGARDTLIQCYIKRHRSSHTYYLFLGLSSGEISFDPPESFDDCTKKLTSL